MTENNIIIDDGVIRDMIEKINSIRNNVDDDFNRIISYMNQVKAAWNDPSTGVLQDSFTQKKSELPRHLENLDACKRELESRLTRYEQEFINKNIQEVENGVN